MGSSAAAEEKKEDVRFSVLRFTFYIFLILCVLRSFIFFGALILRILYTLEFSIPINPLRDLVHKRVHS